MNVIAGFKDTNIGVIVQPTIQAFVPLLEKNRAEIESAKRKTFKFGDTERHQLDVYYPPASAKYESSKPPILVFAYGGGFISGERVYPPPIDLGYKALGAFFAKLGFITVIPDYRLVPSAHFPEPAEDIRDAILYVVQNVTEADTNRIFLYGHSAGAVHIATLTFNNDLLLSTTLRERIKGVVLSGCPYKYGATSPGETLLQYYGSEAGVESGSPIALLNSASNETIAALPRILVFSAENEPDALVAAREAFIPVFKNKTGKEVKSIFGKGHNHISSNWALYSGEGEEWAYEIADWFGVQV